MAVGATSAVNPPAPTAPGSAGTVLRPVVFVVDATRPSFPRGGSNRDCDNEDDGEEPFNVRRTSSSSSVGGDIIPGGDDDGGRDDLYETFLAALRGKPPGTLNNYDNNDNLEEDLSVAASFVSSVVAPFGSSPGGGGNEPDPSWRRLPPLLRPPAGALRRRSRACAWDTGRHRVPSRRTTTTIDPPAGPPEAPPPIARYDAFDPYHAANAASSQSSLPDNVSSALGSYGCDNPPVDFMKRRARIEGVGRRHAFPPSKYPQGR